MRGRRGFTLIELLIVVAIIAIILAGVGRSCVGINPNYSNGDRIGVVTKLSEKGMIWKSWEGEALIALPGTMAAGAQPEKFEFNVAPVAVSKVQQAMVAGTRVKLLYHQWWAAPMTIDNPHVVVDVQEIVEEKGKVK